MTFTAPARFVRRYHLETPVIKNISFCVPGGKTIALVGATGSGEFGACRRWQRWGQVVAAEGQAGGGGKGRQWKACRRAAGVVVAAVGGQAIKSWQRAASVNIACSDGGLGSPELPCFTAPLSMQDHDHIPNVLSCLLVHVCYHRSLTLHCPRPRHPMRL